LSQARKREGQTRPQADPQRAEKTETEAAKIRNPAKGADHEAATTHTDRASKFCMFAMNTETLRDYLL